jgi:hypothetical protein
MQCESTPQREASPIPLHVHRVVVMIALAIDQARARDELTFPLATLPRLTADIVIGSGESWPGRPLVLEATTRPDWDRFSDKLDSFGSLLKGWDGDEADPPNRETVDRAKSFLSSLEGASLRPNRLAPSVVGGVGFTFRLGDLSAYVEFNNKGSVYALYSDAVTDPQVERIAAGLLGFSELIDKIKQYLHE